MRKGERGIAIITVLLLSLISLGFIGAVLFLTTQGSKTALTGKRYMSALETAKGVAEYIINEVEASSGTLSICEAGTCTPGARVDLTRLDTGNYDVTAIYLGSETGTNFDIYAFRITVVGQNSSERAEVEFVYRKNLNPNP